MAKTKKKSTQRTPAKRSAGSRASLICPECGFKAAHAMGLGRHRSSRHGVVSKRQQMRRAPITTAADGRRARALERRLEELERRYDDLLGGLTKALASAKKRGR